MIIEGKSNARIYKGTNIPADSENSIPFLVQIRMQWQESLDMRTTTTTTKSPNPNPNPAAGSCWTYAHVGLGVCNKSIFPLQQPGPSCQTTTTTTTTTPSPLCVDAHSSGVIISKRHVLTCAHSFFRPTPL